MKLMLKVCCLGFVSLLAVMMLSPAYADIKTNFFQYSSGTFNLSYGSGYWWGGDSQATGSNYSERANPVKNGIANMKSGFNTSYVPFSGRWKMRMHFCSAPSGAVNCTISRSSGGFADSDSAYLTSGRLIVDQSPRLMFPAGTAIPANGAICYSFVNEDDGSVEWNTEAMRTCQDAHVLPETPSTCYLNYGEDLDVDMGALERGDIVTTPGTSVSTVKKTVPVLCTRDAGVTVRTSFQFTPLTISGKEVIKSSSNGLGIAIRYNHKVVSPSDSFTEDYAVGYTNIELEFEAVRDPAVAVKDVPTGDFSANAVMVMTQE